MTTWQFAVCGYSFGCAVLMCMAAVQVFSSRTRIREGVLFLLVTSFLGACAGILWNLSEVLP